MPSPILRTSCLARGSIRRRRPMSKDNGAAEGLSKKPKAFVVARNGFSLRSNRPLTKAEADEMFLAMERARERREREPTLPSASVPFLDLHAKDPQRLD